ncbi:MAG: hypothetical protein IKL55_00555 [Clostridia bacterium]|nr:hypothetical protein [Clostridia bacterium]
MYSVKPFFQIMDELCKEKNIIQNEISYGWITQLKKNNVSKYIIGYQFDLNSAIAYNIAGDKFATYEVLKSNNIPTIEHRMIFNPQTRSRYYKNKFLNEAKDLFRRNKNKLVIKANDSCKGKDVHFCSEEKEIENIVQKLFEENNDTLSACPYVDISYEYRAIYLCGEILYIYKKKKPYIIGNGRNTVKELIDFKFNKNMNVDICRDLDLDKVPFNGQEVTISWKHNLSSGAEPIVIDETDEFISQVREVAIKAGDALNIKFASVDVVVTENKEILVMEVNGSVCMNKFSEIIPNGYEIAKAIYSKAIDKMFE